MSESSAWTVQLGRWNGVALRVHALFFAVAIFVLFLSTSEPAQPSLGYGLLAIGVLFMSVLLHEVAHYVAAHRLGGGSDQMVIGPLGGMATAEARREPQAELLIALAGPLANLGILLLSLPVMVGAHVGLMPLLSPLEPSGLVEGAWWIVLLKLTFWMNWLLLLVNLLPAFPLDGARILRSLLWPAFEYRQAAFVAVRATRLTAVAMCLLAWWTSEPETSAVVPTWVPLLLFATFLHFSGQQAAARARQEENEWDEDLLSYDFSQGYTSLERTLEPGRPRGASVRRWLQNRREVRRRRRQSLEQEEERQVDEILLRLHQSGMDGISEKERLLLHRVSARYRNRQQN